jgi:phosphoribosyl 1,2-cyclic phosphodiesterase
MIDITFYGVRGSTPCSCDETKTYGGNTSCVLVQLPNEHPIVLDLGTGLRYLGERLLKEYGEQPFQGTALVSHLHWDHVQGLPFFKPLMHGEASLSIVGPRQASGSLQDAVESFVSPPLFPVDLRELPGSVTFREADNETFSIGSATISAAEVAHCGTTNGYRILNGAGSMAYLSDHQAPMDGSLEVPASVVELCRGVDVLIHDAQYDNDEFAQRIDWGHSTIDYAVSVARAAGVGRLVLFHHDPSHDDAWIDDAVAHARALADGAFEVLAAHEGLELRSGDDALL